REYGIGKVLPARRLGSRPAVLVEQGAAARQIVADEVQAPARTHVDEMKRRASRHERLTADEQPGDRAASFVGLKTAPRELAPKIVGSRGEKSRHRVFRSFSLSAASRECG